MRALILAAGRGSRMRSLTAHKPKCLVELAGRALLDWQLGALRESGIQDIAVVRGYCREALAGSDYTVFDNPRWAQTNMVSSLMCADAWLRQGDCILSYSDIVYHPDAVRALATSSGEIALTYDRLWKHLWLDRFEDPLSDAETFRCDAAGRLLEIGHRATSLAQIEGQYMGLLKLTAAGWGSVYDYLQSLPQAERDGLDMTALLGRLLVRGTGIQAVGVDGQWCEVDSDEDLETYTELLGEVMPWRHDWRWEEAA